jgi:hypothetical protein
MALLLGLFKVGAQSRLSAADVSGCPLPTVSIVWTRSPTDAPVAAVRID